MSVRLNLLFEQQKQRLLKTRGIIAQIEAELNSQRNFAIKLEGAIDQLHYLLTTETQEKQQEEDGGE